MKSKIIKDHEIESWLEPGSASTWNTKNMDDLLVKINSLSKKQLRECFFNYSADIEKYLKEKGAKQKREI